MVKRRHLSRNIPFRCIAPAFVWFLIVFCGLIGCGGAASDAGGPSSAPIILSQPADESVPMGLTGAFQVEASGGSLSYQWRKNGIPVGSSSSLYTTPATLFTDDDSLYQVTVSNAKGSVTSNPATLHVTARAPLAGDLRFQQVDAASTVNGYVGEELTNLPGAGDITFSNSTGAAPLIGPNCPATSDGLYGVDGCNWTFNSFSLPLSVTSLNYGYLSDSLSNFDAVLNGRDPGYQNIIGALDAPNRVITSLNIESQDNAFNLSWIESTANVYPFNMVQNVVSPAAFQAAASSEGAAGRVISAVTYDGANIHYISYGWQGDPSTSYEVQITTSTLDQSPEAATALSAAGYIITAFGGDAQNGVILVGTRVRGDTMQRPMLVEAVLSGGSLAQIPAGGYAFVGWVYNGQTTYSLYTAIGQR